MNEKEVESEEDLSPMKPYASDLSDAEWTILEPLIPPAKLGGRPRSVNMRQILNGIFYVLRSGCAWRLLPHDYPAWSTVYDYFRKWRNADIWEQLVRTLRERLRVQGGRQATPSACAGYLGRLFSKLEAYTSITSLACHIAISKKGTCQEKR
jgi:putative transposase